MQVIEDNLLHLLVHLLLFSQNNVSFPLDCRSLQFRVLQNVGDDVDGLVDVLAEALGVVDGLLSGRVGVEMGTQVLDLELELVLRSSAGSLEGHVLEEVGGTVRAVGLGSGPSIDPNSDGGRLGVRVRFRRDGQSVVEGGDLRERAGDGGRERTERSGLREKESV